MAKSIFKSMAALAISLICTYLFGRFVSIPIIPCVSVYAAALLFLDERGMGFRRVCIIIAAVVGAITFICMAVYAIKRFPDFVNTLGIISFFITAFAYLGAGIFNLAAGIRD
ncbi:MAG: dimethyl sulfoxide reductase anchor subunit [Firmicutes bacterium]|nr:dimethyl sulfoxide reductase anchor subunit [Bacillota bacterium]MBQ1501909.1 dimethyl sulfoxide reductase anchor subunit [Bacillota bacterium]